MSGDDNVDSEGAATNGDNESIHDGSISPYHELSHENIDDESRIALEDHQDMEQCSKNFTI